MSRTFSRRARTRAAAAALVALAAVTAAPAPASALPGSSAGTLIAALPQPSGWRSMPGGGTVVSYWTTRADGSPVRASGALFVPPGPAPAAGWPVLAWDHGTAGLGPRCGGQAVPLPRPAREKADRQGDLLRRLLSRGFAVAAPDYIGNGLFDTGVHPYLEVRSQASATIDMVRAARAARPELSRTWAVVGESQGGHAALSTGHRQASYAPELDFRGTIAIDPGSDVEKLLQLAGPYVPVLPAENDTVVALVVTILGALRAARPDAAVDSYLTPLGRRILDDTATLCMDGIGQRTRGLGIGALLATPLAVGPFRRVIEDYMTLPTTGYDAPILLLLNAADKVVPSPLHATLVAQLAAAGTGFEVVPGVGEHVVLSPEMYAAIDRFLARIQPAGR